MEIEHGTYNDDIKKLAGEGLVLCGTGGDLQEWVKGVTSYLHDMGAVTSNDPDKIWDRVVVFDTTSAKPKRTDMLMLFPENSDNIIIGKLAIVRIRMNDEITRTSWLSDYKDNFKKDHKV